MAYADVTARPNRSIVQVEAPAVAQVRFNGAAVDSPRALLHMRAAASDVRAAAVGTRQNATLEPDYAYVINDLGNVSPALPCYGNQACAIELAANAFLVCLVDTSTTWRKYLIAQSTMEIVSVTDAMPFPPEAGLPHGTSQGFRDLVGGVPLFYDDQLTPIVLDGVSFWRHMTRGAWTVGLLHDNRVALWDGVSGERYITGARSQVQARLALKPDGTPIVAVSTDAGGLFLSLSDFAIDEPDEPVDPDEPTDPDEPVDPDEPDEPEGPMMIFFREPHKTTDAPNVDRGTPWGTKMPLSDGRFWVKKPNGKAATLTPSGKWEERDAPDGYQPGDWEIFQPAKPAGTWAKRVDSGVPKDYYLETYED